MLFRSHGDTVTGTEESIIASMNVFPNPFTNELRITGAEGYKMQMLTTAGAIVHAQSITNHEQTVCMKHLPAGAYILRLMKNGKEKTLKVLKL